jgi:hypothetical protein
MGIRPRVHLSGPAFGRPLECFTGLSHPHKNGTLSRPTNYTGVFAIANLYEPRFQIRREHGIALLQHSSLLAPLCLRLYDRISLHCNSLLAPLCLQISLHCTSLPCLCSHLSARTSLLAPLLMSVNQWVLINNLQIRGESEQNWKFRKKILFASFFCRRTQLFIVELA